MKICNPKVCVGCGVCADACPKGCITLLYDKEGFLKSNVDTALCVQCGLCARVCPVNKVPETHSIIGAYKVNRLPRESATNSTSGGVAAALSEYVVVQKGVVYGTGWSDCTHIAHSCAKTVEETDAFKGSKYIQSYVVGCYKDIKTKLKDGQTVLFTGTPCQNAALKNYLGTDYENLYLVDFVCHGVGSQKVFSAYMDYLTTEKGATVQSVEFRNKSLHGYEKSNLKVVFENGKEHLEGSYSDTIGLWFASGLSVGESCYACPYAYANRVSDVTLADYVGDDMNDADKRYGTSMVFVNTEKGERFLQHVSVELTPKPLEGSVKKYARLHGEYTRPRCRKKFFADLEKKGFSIVLSKYDLKKILPNKIVLYLRAIKKRLFKI